MKTIHEMRTDLGKLLTELEGVQEKMRAGPLSQTEGEAAEAKAHEAEALQKDIDKYDGRDAIIKKGREVRDPALPASGEQQKAGAVAGYVTLGDFVLASAEFAAFRGKGFPTGSHAALQVDGVIHGKNAIRGPRGEPMVALSREQRKALEAAIESKAVPTLGTGVLETERLDRFPQVTASDQLRMRDVLATGQTGSSGVTYMREEAHTQTAAETAHGVAKPEEALEYTEQTAGVKTIAGWMPVHNQQLDDLPQLRSLIDGRLRYSVSRREEYQLLWGTGSGANIEGLFDVTGTTDIDANGRYNAATPAFHTLIDAVRMGITDVSVAGYEANAAVMHPYDFETIVLEKGTDNRYVWVVVTDANGTRLWGLRVVETVAAQQRLGVATEARRLLVGDFQMGAQILDRMQLNVLVGFINAQFTENMRTILAEERIAFPIYAPAAFAWLETQASAT